MRYGMTLVYRTYLISVLARDTTFVDYTLHADIDKRRIDKYSEVFQDAFTFTQQETADR